MSPSTPELGPDSRRGQNGRKKRTTGVAFYATPAPDSSVDAKLAHLALAIGALGAMLTATELRRQHYENVSAQVADWLRSEVASYRQEEHSERVVARAARHASDEGEGDDHGLGPLLVRALGAELLPEFLSESLGLGRLLADLCPYAWGGWLD